MKRLIAGAVFALALGAGASGPAMAQNAVVGGTAAGVATGALVGGPVGAVVGGMAGMAAGTAVDASRPRYVVSEPMATGSIAPGGVIVMDRRTQDAWDRCAKLYKSFDPSTGMFVGEDGMVHLCQ
ncbi:BA14K family protein [Alsobacter sp. SYSU M60028]|uniref:Lectin-like protein BA14k n=1 Tax=Alsobacter ponti TaxID=2962936 RepID=A0ABT1LKL6_9HYPH|nr:BA14K family protein [Alsobacter ponti]MCP8940788.1 BA14K family protein [Alsobacter ponti]